MSKSLCLALFAVLCFQSALGKLVPKEALYDFKELVTTLGYPYEEHKITTDDGYILTFHRIQAKNTQIQSGLRPVLVNHGLLDSSDSFVFNDEAECPGYILANAGFDVWFTNNRGNKYSQEHVDPTHYNPDKAGSAFWDFSWQEMSFFDLPAGLRYIGGFTGQKVDYVGHSEGTTIMFAALARRDDVVLQHLGKFVALAPAVFLQHSTSPLVQLGGWIQAGRLVHVLGNLLNQKKFGHMNTLTRKASSTLCVVALPVCLARVRLLSDSDTSVDNVQRLKVTSGHYPAGSSVQNLYYWSQMFNKNEFPMYDYGTQRNVQVYGTPNPPTYNLGAITEPVYIFVGEFDHLASPADTATLRARLTGSSNVEYRRYPLGHGSFLWGKDVQGYMVDVLSVLNS